MGRYINWGDISARYSDTPKASDAPNAELVFIPQAEAEVDACLAARYDAPFVVTTPTDAPQLVRSLSIDIAYWMMNRRQDWAEKFRDRIDDLLEKLADGTMVLTNSAGQMGSSEDSTISVPGLRSSFGVNDPESWSPSSGWPGYLTNDD
jgi:phage gp36-like protein